MTIKLTCGELRLLLRNHNSTLEGGGHGGGFQNYMTQLGYRVDEDTGELELGLEDLNRINRYATNYGKGGFQGRLFGIFMRTLGVTLGWKAKSDAHHNPDFFQ